MSSIQPEFTEYNNSPIIIRDKFQVSGAPNSIHISIIGFIPLLVYIVYMGHIYRPYLGHSPWK